MQSYRQPSHPSRILEKEIKERGWSVQEFCDRLNKARVEMRECQITDEWNVHSVSFLLKDHYLIDNKIAENLSICLGTSPEFWINLMDNWILESNK